MNIILNTDSYKASHWLQYPPGVTNVFSYIESRGGVHPFVQFFGLQAFLKELASERVTEGDVDEAKEFFARHGVPFNFAGWYHLVEKHKGKLPVRIRAVYEGSLIPNGVPLVTIENTDPEFPWLTSYLETALLRAVWYPTTVATRSFYAKTIIAKYLKETADDMSSLPFKLHDFGARGVSSLESAGLGGMAHLVNFQGSDTISGVRAAEFFYGWNPEDGCAGYSIPAAEHSTITSWGKDRERDAFERMVDIYGTGLYAVVSDSYDIHNAVDKLWPSLKEKIKRMGGTLVVRPDSGDPCQTVLSVTNSLAESFGTTLNSKGFKVLNGVRVIQGDGVNLESIEAILCTLKLDGFSAENIAFGMGGHLLQDLTRDTQKFAMKASAVKENGVWRGISKAPVGDASKASKAGRVDAVMHDFSDFPYSSVQGVEGEESIMATVFEDGKVRNTETFKDIRARADLGLEYHARGWLNQ